MKGCGNKRVIPKEIIDTIYGHTSIRAAREAVAREYTGVNEAAIVAVEARLLVLSGQAKELADSIKILGGIPEVLSALKEVQEERVAAEGELALLKATVIPVGGNGWREQGEVWNLERNDPQRLSAMLRSVGYSMTVHGDKTITSSHSDTTYKFASVDRKSTCYRLYLGDRLALIPKYDGQQDVHYSEPFDSDYVATSEWTEEDYADLRRQYEG